MYIISRDKKIFKMFKGSYSKSSKSLCSATVPIPVANVSATLPILVSVLESHDDNQMIAIGIPFAKNFS